MLSFRLLIVVCTASSITRWASSPAPSRSRCSRKPGSDRRDRAFCDNDNDNNNNGTSTANNDLIVINNGSIVIIIVIIIIKHIIIIVIISGSIVLRPFFILRVVRPRIFESKLRSHCAKKLDGALRKSTSFVWEFVWLKFQNYRFLVWKLAVCLLCTSCLVSCHVASCVMSCDVSCHAVLCYVTFWHAIPRCICLLFCLCIYTYIYIYTQIEREREKYICACIYIYI